MLYYSLLYNIMQCLLLSFCNTKSIFYLNSQIYIQVSKYFINIDTKQQIIFYKNFTTKNFTTQKFYFQKFQKLCYQQQPQTTSYSHYTMMR